MVKKLSEGHEVIALLKKLIFFFSFEKMRVWSGRRKSSSIRRNGYAALTDCQSPLQWMFRGTLFANMFFVRK
jgi:hypothetical protein